MLKFEKNKLAITMYMTVMPSKSWSRRIYETVGCKQKKRKKKPTFGKFAQR